MPDPIGASSNKTPWSLAHQDDCNEPGRDTQPVSAALYSMDKYLLLLLVGTQRDLSHAELVMTAWIQVERHMAVACVCLKAVQMSFLVVTFTPSAHVV